MCRILFFIGNDDFLCIALCVYQERNRLFCCAEQ